MATDLAIDPDLLEKALAIGGQKTKKAVIAQALREYIERREADPVGSTDQSRILELFGQLDWDDDYDYKAARSRG